MDKMRDGIRHFLKIQDAPKQTFSIRELLDLITTNTGIPANTQQHNNVQQPAHTVGNSVVPQQKGIQHPLLPGQTNHNYYGNNVPTQGRVTFYFKNTTIDGFFRNA